MDPRDFHKTARQLIELPTQLESNYRSAISRGYYSAFLRIQVAISKQAGAVLLARAQLGKKLGHEWIISALLNSATNEIALIGRRLDELRQDRIVADYDVGTIITKERASKELERVAELHSAIDSFGLPKIVACVIQHIRELANARTGS